jgi:hypothetical protein
VLQTPTFWLNPCLFLQQQTMSKNKPAPPPIIDNYPELVQKIEELTKMFQEQSKMVSSYASRFDKLEKLWSDTKQENKQLKEAIQEKER